MIRRIVRFCLLLFFCLGTFVEMRILKTNNTQAIFKSKGVMKSKVDFRNPSEINFIAGDPLTEEDFKRGDKLKESDVEFPRPDPTESGYFEGDILEDLNSRNAIKNPHSLWPKGNIPYVLSKDYDNTGRSVIAKAMKQYHEKTCIRFVPRTNEKDYVFISPQGGCASYVGMIGGAQGISISRGCYLTGIVIHELMHAAGFMHEQSRTDRDEHIDIQWDNIKPGREVNFQKYSLKEIQDLEEKYDYDSVLHYDQYAFARDGRRPTIIPKTKGAKIGQRIGFSKTDLKKINKLYKCEGNNQRPPA